MFYDILAETGMRLALGMSPKSSILCQVGYKTLTSKQ